jgi:hypothetical protein
LSEHYYFCATLPTLLPGMPPPMRFQDFLRKASELLPPAKSVVLENARLYIPGDGAIPAPAGDSPLLRSYYAWELSFRNELAVRRAERMGIAPERFTRPGEIQRDVARIAQAAAALENPLEAELLIERERWATIDRLETGHSFDLERLVAYALKLQSMERRARFETARGERAFSAAYDSILESASPDRAEDD